MNSESTFSDALSEVDVAIAAANYERAIALTDELLVAYPDAVSVWRARARAFSASGKPFQAAEAYGRVLDVLPADADAIANLAQALDACGRTGEARLVAQQALDYESSNETLQRIAADEGETYLSDPTGEQLRDGLAQAQIGLLDRGIARLRQVMTQWPDRVDVQVAMAHALWRNGSRVAAAELCQSILDAQPDCLNAHALLLSLWNEIGPASLENLHARAIDRADPDHRCVKALFGEASPVEVLDVPAIRSVNVQQAAPEEDAQDRTDWVNDLVAAASSAPKPLERPPSTLTLDLNFASDAPSLEGDDISITHDALDASETNDENDRDSDGDNGVVETLIPLEWEEPEDALNDEPEHSASSPAWLPDTPDAGDNFVPSRPKSTVPDAKDGVPATIEPLEWESNLQHVDAPVGAVEDATDAIELEPEGTAPPPALPESESQSITPPNHASKTIPKKAAERIAAARQAVEGRHWEDAFALYEKAIASNKGKNMDEIISDLQSVARERPTSRRVYDLLGLAYMRKRDVSAALDAYHRAMELSEDA